MHLPHNAFKMHNEVDQWFSDQLVGYGHYGAKMTQRSKYKIKRK